MNAVVAAGKEGRTGKRGMLGPSPRVPVPTWWLPCRHCLAAAAVSGLSQDQVDLLSLSPAVHRLRSPLSFPTLAAVLFLAPCGLAHGLLFLNENSLFMQTQHSQRQSWDPPDGS